MSTETHDKPHGHGRGHARQGSPTRPQTIADGRSNSCVWTSVDSIQAQDRKRNWGTLARVNSGTTEKKNVQEETPRSHSGSETSHGSSYVVSHTRYIYYENGPWDFLWDTLWYAHNMPRTHRTPILNSPDVPRVVNTLLDQRIH